jgi:GT2 family glycosyltransferase
MTATEHLGVVVIGRNEGERLVRCLQSLRHGGPVVYVDSGSTDGSSERAKAFADVVCLSADIPFSMARGRNTGFRHLVHNYPHVQYVFFVDGDCEVVGDWIAQAIGALDECANVAVVCGRRRERSPESSLFNALCDAEWNTPCGDVESCGGDAVMRVSAFSEAGGFDDQLIAGEEPELCHRLRRNGWRILRLNQDMTLHDAAITSFGQWWRRCIRAGYGGMSVRKRLRQSGYNGILPFDHMTSSARLWCIWVPLIITAAAAIICYSTEFSPGPAACAAGLSLLAVWVAQSIRIAARQERTTDSGVTPLWYGSLTMIAKLAQLLGQVRFYLDWVRRKKARLIEYK